MQASFIQKSIVVAFGSLAMLGAMAGASHAWTLNESATAIPGRTDAGPLTGTAGVLPTFDPGTNVLRGGLAANGGADLYRFDLAQDGTFTAFTFERGSNPLKDAQLFLFDSVGAGITGNNPLGPVSATISRLLTVGTYYIGISSSSFDPRTAINGPNKFIFQADDSTLNLPGMSLASWADRVGETKAAGGTYGINLSFAPTPVPTPALLPGLAALGFNAIRKRKAKAAVA